MTTLAANEYHVPLLKQEDYSIAHNQSFFSCSKTNQSSSAKISLFVSDEIRPLYIEYIYTQHELKKAWAETYKKVMKELEDKLAKNSFIEDSLSIFKQNELMEISEFISLHQTQITNNDDFFYALSNLLSKYAEIKHLKAERSFSILNDNAISLTLWKKNHPILKNEEYVSKLNLVFTPENDVRFSSSDSDDEDYFVHGTLSSPSSFFANRKIKRILRILDE